MHPANVVSKGHPPPYPVQQAANNQISSLGQPNGPNQPTPEPVQGPPEKGTKKKKNPSGKKKVKFEKHTQKTHKKQRENHLIPSKSTKLKLPQVNERKMTVWVRSDGGLGNEIGGLDVWQGLEKMGDVYNLSIFC